MIQARPHPSGLTTLETRLEPPPALRIRWPERPRGVDRGAEFALYLDLMARDWGNVEFDWPPRLTFEQQQMIVYEDAQNRIRFSGAAKGGWGLPTLNVTPRPVRQRLYRASR